MIKEVICIDTRLAGTFDEKGKPTAPSLVMPKEGEIYPVDEVIESFKKIYYHIPGLDDLNGELCFWDSNLFADITGLQNEISNALSISRGLFITELPGIREGRIETQEEFEKRSRHNEPDWITKDTDNRWLHIGVKPHTTFEEWVKIMTGQ